jgi:hypothetical protein
MAANERESRDMRFIGEQTTQSPLTEDEFLLKSKYFFGEHLAFSSPALF